MLPVSFPWSMADAFFARYSLLFKLLASSLKANSYCDSRSQIGTRCSAVNSEHLTPTTASNAGLMDASVRCGDVQREKRDIIPTKSERVHHGTQPHASTRTRFRTPLTVHNQKEYLLCQLWQILAFCYDPAGTQLSQMGSAVPCVYGARPVSVRPPRARSLSSFLANASCVKPALPAGPIRSGLVLACVFDASHWCDSALVLWVPCLICVHWSRLQRGLDPCTISFLYLVVVRDLLCCLYSWRSSRGTLCGYWANKVDP